MHIGGSKHVQNMDKIATELFYNGSAVT